MCRNTGNARNTVSVHHCARGTLSPSVEIDREQNGRNGEFWDKSGAPRRPYWGVMGRVHWSSRFPTLQRSMARVEGTSQNKMGVKNIEKNIG